MPSLPPSLPYVIFFFPPAYKITERLENTILFPFPGQRFSLQNKKASNAGGAAGMGPGGCAGSLGAAGGPARPQPFTRSWSHRPAVGRTVTFRNTPESRVSGSRARALARRSAGCARTDAGSRQRRRLGAFAALHRLENAAKWGPGVHWGLLVLDVPTGSEGQGLLQLGRGMKQPWSRGAGEDRALQLTLACAVVSGPSPRLGGLIQSRVTPGWDRALAGERVGSVGAACQAEHPEAIPSPQGSPPRRSAGAARQRRCH